MAVIVQHAQLHECGADDVIGPIMVRMAEDALIPVCVMLDHGRTLPM